MIGIVYATMREAAPFLKLVAAEPLTRRPMPLFVTSGDKAAALVAVSGMGKVAAAMAATHLVVAHEVTLLLNAGLCGQLTQHRRWQVGDLLRVSSVVEGDCDRLGQAAPRLDCDAHCFSQLESARLVTSDRPVFQTDRRGQLALLGELADMEGAAVAWVARRYDIPCAMLKGISDSADETGRADVARHVQRVSLTIAETLTQELTKPTTDIRS
jgi:adenosylhomocysteine nucleosidase